MPDDELFQRSTSGQAGEKASHRVGAWRERILRRLEECPSTIFEVAKHFGVPDHTISGRFSELVKDGYIEHSGDRRRKPQTDCDAEVYQLRRADRGVEPDLADKLGYPPTLKIGNDLYDRQRLLLRESYPGIPYARRADTGGLRHVVRVALVECEKCGKPITIVGKDDDGQQFQCMNCATAFRVRSVNETGRGPMLALVMEVL
ncbi:MAG: winged helix-turn-helix transcriptional regulator [Anaerolineae bacterium]|nr:winged helix-turn-helix transcriptional regulator [Phycisphaerae bacterium]